MLAPYVVLCLALAGITEDECSSPNTGAVWEEIRPRRGEVPGPRLAHAAIGVGDKLYVHGGFYGGSKHADVYNDLWTYDGIRQGWEEIDAVGDIPSPRMHHSMVVGGSDNLILFGGFNTFASIAGHDALDDLYKYHIPSKRWTRLDTQLKTKAKPTKRGAHAAVWLNGAMYVFGGFPKISPMGHSSELWKFDLDAMEWTDLTPRRWANVSWPDPRIGFAFTPVGGMGHLHAGGCPLDSSRAGNCGDDWMLDPAHDAFEPLEATNAPHHRRATQGGFLGGGRVFLFGGVYINGTEVTMLDDTHLLDIEQKNWRPLSPHWNAGPRPPPTFGHTVSRLGGKIVVFGGRTHTPLSPGSRQLWELQLD
eukprot:Hpha_TRINITY_DN14992_c1_g1::TRINITY_DN14992_c1_g1_i4::g.144927::m.144927